MKLIVTLYWSVLRTLGLGERRCGWCKKFQGWKRIANELLKSERPTTHGICKPCLIKWEADGERTRAAQLEQQLKQQRKVQKRIRDRQRTRRSTLRRRTGGWSGAVASCGRVS